MTKVKSPTTEARAHLDGTISRLASMIDHSRSLETVCDNAAGAMRRYANSVGEIFISAYDPKSRDSTPQRLSDLLEAEAKKLAEAIK